jgi:hypothetical protein
MDDFGCGCDRLDGACFVVGRHQRNEGPPPSEMVFGELFLKHAEVDNPIARHRNSACALAIEPASGEHGRMLNRRDVTMPGLAGLRGKCQRVGFAAAAREDHILGLGAGEPCNFRPCGFDERPRLPALLMHRGGIAVGRQRGHDCLAHLRPQRSCGVVIEIRTRRHASEARRPKGPPLALARAPIAHAMKRGPRLGPLRQNQGRSVLVWNNSKSYVCIGFLSGRVKFCGGAPAIVEAPGPSSHRRNCCV